MENGANFDVKKELGWAVVAVRGRLDSFNFDPFCAQLEQLLKAGEKRVVLDLANAKFLSFPCIKYLTSLALDLEEGGGGFALLGASEKLIRQIDIYATLNPMRVVRRLEELNEAPPLAIKKTATVKPARKPSAEA